MDVERSTVQMISWTLGVYDPDFLAIHKDKGKRSKVCNTLASFISLMVVNDPGIFRQDLVRRLMLIPMLLLRNFKRVIPPCTRLLRLACSSPFFWVLGEPFQKEKVFLKRSIPRHSGRQKRGSKFLRTDWKSDLVQLMRN
jgi:hypothetical protein